MLVRDIMTMGIETISSDQSVCQAAQKMRSLGVGALAVQAENRIIGIVSKKDIVYRCIAEESDPQSTEVSDIMTSELVTCWEDDSLEDIAHILEDKHLHRLLVMSSDNEPVGIVSLSDMAVKAENEHLSWEILERISEPACPNR